MDMMFVPENFVFNLKYMGLGMLGIFVAIGVIMLCTMILNAVSNRKKKEEKETGQE